MTKERDEHRERYATIGCRISYYRKQRKMTQEEMAEQLQVSCQHIGAIEATNVKRKISLDLLFNIADLLEVEPKCFLEYQELPFGDMAKKSKE